MSQPVDLLENLNPAQRKAVEAGDGPTLVIAGPGSGKTRVLTQRIAWLIEQKNVYGYRIMAVTFTNKAAREMKERLGRAIGQSKAEEVALGTFHSICGRLLRREAPSVGLDRNFAIYDSDDQVSVVKAILAEQNIDDKKFKPAGVHARISTAKNELQSPADFKATSYFDEIVKRVYERYNAVLRANNALDFDDLLMESVILLRNVTSVRERMQERYVHVLVDEFQDTNQAQYEFVSQVAGRHKNIFCVGDMDQSIYSWRGADYRNLLRLKDDYPKLTTIPLEQNYRSTQTVLDAAMAVIKKNPNRVHVSLFTNRGTGPKIILRELFDETEEAQYVVDTIRELIREKAAEPGEISIMYRTNAQSRAMEDAFVRAKLKYRLVGATRFYQRKEVKDALAFLKIINNPADAVSLKRIINVPPRGIGDKSFEQLESAARSGNMTCFDALTRGNIEGRGAKSLTSFGNLWNSWVAMKDDLNVGDLFDRVLKSVGLQMHFADGSDEGLERWGNVVELLNVAAAAGDTLLPEFLAELALVSETDNLDEGTNAPTLLTLHAAKGLEFRVVFLVGLEEGVLPHSRTLDDPEALQEERRLMYVGITRAKDRLYLLRAFRRGQWGTTDYSEPSRFLADLPVGLVDGVTKKARESIDSMSQWPTTTTRISTTSPASWQKPLVARPTDYASQTMFKPGDRIYHQKFGEGVVLKAVKLRDDEEVEAFFGSAGKKRISATISGIKKV